MHQPCETEEQKKRKEKTFFKYHILLSRVLLVPVCRRLEAKRKHCTLLNQYSALLLPLCFLFPTLLSTSATFLDFFLEEYPHCCPCCYVVFRYLHGKKKYLDPWDEWSFPAACCWQSLRSTLPVFIYCTNKTLFPIFHYNMGQSASLVSSMRFNPASCFKMRDNPRRGPWRNISRSFSAYTRGTHAFKHPDVRLICCIENEGKKRGMLPLRRLSQKQSAGCSLAEAVWGVFEAQESWCVLMETYLLPPSLLLPQPPTETCALWCVMRLPPPLSLCLLSRIAPSRWWRREEAERKRFTFEK